MARNIKTTVPYITHIIRSYEKHYIKHKKVLEPIAAIVEESALSLNESVNEKPKQEEEEGYYETTYNNYMTKKNQLLENNQYKDSEPVGDLLLESQRSPQLAVKTPQKEPEVKDAEKDKRQEIKIPELNSLVEPPKELKEAVKEQSKMLLTVKSESNLKKNALQSPRDDLNNSG